MDPLQGSAWSTAGTVEAFARSAPNGTLMQFAAQCSERNARILDIGCGAGRNAVPLAGLGRHVTGVDLSWPMLRAAAERYQREPGGRLDLVLAPMERLPVQDASMDFVIAHGIWNLARSAAEFRAAVREAGRVCKPRANLFVFTFSRTTLPPEAKPVAGESFVFTGFSGEPQCFLTAEQLLAELLDGGFEPDPAVPLTEHNRPRAGSLRTGASPVIYEGAFRRRDERIKTIESISPRRVSAYLPQRSST
jgi:SAM-dependent methyltransferase